MKKLCITIHWSQVHTPLFGAIEPDSELLANLRAFARDKPLSFLNEYVGTAFRPSIEVELYEGDTK